ncbi:zinc finger protein 490-like isoform X2 [Bradysia coprophila]|uniref:zinc finger protein 490-like isoform X2 n=1 Tax=Bradysia coprophila TaxID=38358 RepID=UPI00187DCFB9|nr:zinc finger protein 490-like isoform X2 [Bradysia coprophila]
MNSYFTDEETLILLKLVHTKDLQDKFNSNKKRHRKVWEEIAKILEKQGIRKSAAKCQNRYENTKRTYNTIKRNHIGPQKPNYPYWDFWESILGEKRDMPFGAFDEHHETYLRLKEARDDGDAVPPDWEHWSKYDEYYKQKRLTAESDLVQSDNAKCTQLSQTFTDAETDELLLIMGERATRQMFVNHRKKHRIAWNYILKCLKKRGIHKTAEKVKNRFENLKRKYMHYKKSLTSSMDPPDWRYWNVFEEYMASRSSPSDSDFMADDADADEDAEEMETETDDVDEAITTKEGFQPVETSIHAESTNNQIEPESSDSRTDVNCGRQQIFCRFCLQSMCNTSISLFSPLNANIRINEALAICCGLEIFQQQDSSTVNEICLDCVQQLQTSYNFRKLCWASQFELKMTNRKQTDRNDGTASPCRRLLPDSIKNPARPHTSAANQSHFENDGTADSISTSPQFEMTYEFVDTDPIHSDDSAPQCVDEKDSVTEPDNSEITDLGKHKKGETNRVEKLKNFKCSLCMKKFPNIEYIKKHLVKMHSLIAESQNFKNHLELSNCDSDDELDDNVKCYVCGKSYVKREYLKKHLKLIHNITDADYNVYDRIDEENKTKKPLLCHSCGESFVLKHIFKKHVEHHERGSLLSCDYCDIKLVDKAALQRHMILHTGQRNHKCIFCAKGFFTRVSQKRHEHNVHTKEKSHICQYCDKKFVMWKFLERHLNTHTAQIVYQCDQCDKKYLNKNHLRVHKFRHAKEPPFKCSVCSKAYFDRSALKKHNYVHIGNPYQCTHCDRSFDRRDKMNNHMQKVHGALLSQNQEIAEQKIS